MEILDKFLFIPAKTVRLGKVHQAFLFFILFGMVGVFNSLWAESQAVNGNAKKTAVTKSKTAAHPSAAVGSGEPSGITPILIGPATDNFWTTLAYAKKIYAGKTVKVTVTPATDSPVMAKASNGDLFMWADPDSARNGKPIYTAFAEDRYRILASGEHVLFHSDTKENPMWMGRDRQGAVYLAEGEETKLIGACKGYEIMPDGSSEFMTRSTNERDAWTAASDGKIYQLNSEGKLVQVGLCRYQWIETMTSPSTKKLIFMSKAMGAKDKWIGASGGVIYVEK